MHDGNNQNSKKSPTNSHVFAIPVVRTEGRPLYHNTALLNFAWNGANLWNTFFEQSNMRGKLSSMSIGAIKLNLKQSIIQAQNDHDNITWYNTNFTTFYKLHDV